MDRRRQNAMRPGDVEGLEPRSLLSAPTAVPGNTGTIRQSQFLAAIARPVEWEQRGLALHGPLSVRVVSPYQPLKTGGDLLSGASGIAAAATANTGYIAGSQFAAGGFLQVGAQFRRVRAGRGLTIDDYDETVGQPSSGGRPQPAVVSPANTGDVIGTQFNDGGFGNIGLQWRGVQIGGGLTIRDRPLLRNPDGSPVGAPVAGQAVITTGGSPVPIEMTANSNLVLNSQFNDGGFGKVGLQWQDVRVRGPVAIGSQSDLIQPLPTAADSLPAVPAASGSQGGLIYGSPTNTGWIRDSQFNDGGFGDVGFQWWNVAVGGPVQVSTSNLTIQPERDGVGPITVAGLDFARALPVSSTSGGTATPSAAAVSPTAGIPSGSSAATAGSATADPVKNEATNSGRVVRSQFNDGGFGDVGLQWLAVKVDGGVSTVHNSLSVQPENIGQGFITVSNVHFPAGTESATLAPSERRRVLPPSPTIIGDVGGRPLRLVRPPTRPGAIGPVRDEATSSGVIGHSQFADGGFGDVGLQWHDVHVMGRVGIVHNSLSVQPEKAGLAGVAISNISYGDPFTPPPSSRHGVGFVVLPSLAYTPPPQPNQQGGGSNPGGQNNGSPPNLGARDHQQILTSTQADVVLQWDGVHLRRRLVIVHNVITIQSGGPATGPVILKDIRFPGRVPPINASRYATTSPALPAEARLAAPEASTTEGANRSTNSGGLRQNQFAAGGFGNIGLQWRGVKVHGSLTIVHNTLAVNAAATATGPITVSNVVFNSGAFDGATRAVRTRLIVAPPPKLSRLPRSRASGGKVLRGHAAGPNQSVNSGILAGGQYASGGLGQVAIQWRKVGVIGPVTIVDNVLSVRTSGPTTSPVTIQDVTFG